MIVLVPVAFWYISFDEGLLDQRQYKETLDSLKTRTLAFQMENDEQRRINKLLEKADPMQVEIEARKIGMIRPGDQVYQLVQDKDTLNRSK